MQAEKHANNQIYRNRGDSSNTKNAYTKGIDDGINTPKCVSLHKKT